ncbi:MAG: hypothetical protein KDB14_30075 [Planctomycetales bacterium]|nr:hypothetical protein [Planctomycetales bacterium]
MSHPQERSPADNDQLHEHLIQGDSGSDPPPVQMELVIAFERDVRHRQAGKPCELDDEMSALVQLRIAKFRNWSLAYVRVMKENADDNLR